jgi:GT2 family glycosyltransferase
MVLSIVIVHYNARTLLVNCLNSLVASELSFQYEVFVVDNASTETIKDLISQYPEVTFVFNESNCGYGAANNVGMKLAKGKYILLLNPDTIVNKGAFDPMVKYLNEHADTGVVGCRLVNGDGEVERSTHSFPNLIKEIFHANEWLRYVFGYNAPGGRLLRLLPNSKSTESLWEHDTIREVDHVTGACMMVKREAIDKAGMFDEAFFIYNEEVEWSQRIKQAGYKSIFLPESTIVHLFGQSTKQKAHKHVPNRYMFERYRGMFYYFQKHYGPFKLFLLRLIVLEGFSLRIVMDCIHCLLFFKQFNFHKNSLMIHAKIAALAFKNNFDWRVEIDNTNRNTDSR